MALNKRKHKNPLLLRGWQIFMHVSRVAENTDLRDLKRSRVYYSQLHMLKDTLSSLCEEL